MVKQQLEFQLADEYPDPSPVSINSRAIAAHPTIHPIQTMKKLIATLAAAAAVFSFAPDADAGHRRSCHRSYSHRHHHHYSYARGYCAPRVIVRPAYYGGYGYCAPYAYNGYYGGGYPYGYAVRPSINLSFGYGHYGGCHR